MFNPLAKYCFKPWGDHLPFTFKFVERNLRIADITISFLKNGQGGMDECKEAFASPSTDGRVFFNVDLNWSFGAAPGAYDFLTVGLHELGHALGLAHSSVKGVVMWSYNGMNENRVLQDDDVHGIEALYGVK
jgi:predicted Zn-dependent protease